tara:strand:- start:895 stop:1200 length:306 start_codon:yes stop_codon:yes gene_type:complete
MRDKMNNDDLYIIQSDVTGMIKIGRSKNPRKRLKQLQTGNPNKLKLIAAFEGQGWREKIIHERLSRYRLEGEWFSYDCVGSIPDSMYEQISFGSFDEWWHN